MKKKIVKIKDFYSKKMPDSYLNGTTELRLLSSEYASIDLANMIYHRIIFDLI